MKNNVHAFPLKLRKVSVGTAILSSETASIEATGPAHNEHLVLRNKLIFRGGVGVVSGQNSRFSIYVNLSA